MACSEQLAHIPGQPEQSRSGSRDIQLFPINNPSLDTGTVVACKKTSPLTELQIPAASHKNTTIKT